MQMVNRIVVIGAKRVGVVALMLLSACWVTRWAQTDGWVDRIEGDHAVILEEQGERSDEWIERVIPLSDLPVGVQEGDYVSGGVVDREATVAMLKRIMVLQRRLSVRTSDRTPARPSD